MSKSLIDEETKKRLETWWGRKFGIPIWTQDFQGECRKSRLKISVGEEIILKKIAGWIRANEDGTIPREFQSYVRRWWHR